MQSRPLDEGIRTTMLRSQSNPKGGTVDGFTIELQLPPVSGPNPLFFALSAA